MKRILLLLFLLLAGAFAFADTPDQIAAIKAQNAQTRKLNALITQTQAAMNARDWVAAEPLLQKLITEDTGRWDYYQSLGDTQLNEGKYAESAATYAQGIAAAKQAAPKDGKAIAGIGRMLSNQGNAYLKLQKTSEAMDCLRQAVAYSANPAVAWFNICATAYNIGDSPAALDACDKAIAADPQRADAYFIKGSLLYAQGTVGAGNKIIPPPGSLEALKKYLELAPNGSHAADVKEMLATAGS